MHRRSSGARVCVRMCVRVRVRVRVRAHAGRVQYCSRLFLLTALLPCHGLAMKKSVPRPQYAASGAGDESLQMVSKEELRKKNLKRTWASFRDRYPTRGVVVPLKFRNLARPNKDDQRAWTVYSGYSGLSMYQQWLLTPFLVAVEPESWDAPAASGASLRRCGNMQQCTNIFRPEFLAEQHPCVESVERSNLKK